jgi:hypothetical protein
MKDWTRIKKLGGEGILTREDIEDMDVQRNRVLYLMLDGLWHSADQIINYSRGREGLRRMRELREIPGARIERIRSPIHIGGKRDFMYRLVIEKPTVTQRELFE